MHSGCNYTVNPHHTKQLSRRFTYGFSYYLFTTFKGIIPKKLKELLRDSVYID
jgi:hypothetical protein